MSNLWQLQNILGIWRREGARGFTATVHRAGVPRFLQPSFTIDAIENSGQQPDVDIDNYIDDLGTPAGTLTGPTTVQAVGGVGFTWDPSDNEIRINVGNVASDGTAIFRWTLTNTLGTATFDVIVNVTALTVASWINTDTVNLGTFTHGTSIPELNLADYIANPGVPAAVPEQVQFNSDFIGNRDAVVNRNGFVITGTFPTLNAGDSDVALYEIYVLDNSQGDSEEKRFEWTVTYQAQMGDNTQTSGLWSKADNSALWTNANGDALWT